MDTRGNTIDAFLGTLRALDVACHSYRMLIHPAGYQADPPESPGDDSEHWPLVNVTADEERVCLVSPALNSAASDSIAMTVESFMDSCEEAARLFPQAPVLIASEFEPDADTWQRSIEPFIGHQLWVDDRNELVCLQVVLPQDRDKTRQTDQRIDPELP